MADSTQQQLRQAFELIKAGKRKEATQLLLPILKADNNNINAWWLLANSLHDPSDAREALQNVLRLDPDHTNARRMLDKLNELHPPAAAPEPAPESGTFGAGDSASDPFAGGQTEEAESDQVVDLDQWQSEDSPTTVEPFGGPAETFGTSSAFGGEPEPFGTPVSSADPFGSADDVFGVPSGGEDPFGASASARPRRERAADDVFGGPVGAPLPGSRRARTRTGGTNPLLIVLAVIGGIVICGCLACGALSLAGGNILQRVVNEIDTQGLVQTIEAGGSFATLTTGSALPQGVIRRGSLNYGDVRQDTLGTVQQHAWSFSGSGGDRVLIEMSATDTGGLDSYLELYDPNNRLLMADDDGGQNLDARLEYVLPSSGVYTIVARGFGTTGGGYEIRLTRR